MLFMAVALMLAGDDLPNCLDELVPPELVGSPDFPGGHCDPMGVPPPPTSPIDPLDPRVNPPAPPPPPPPPRPYDPSYT
jgi:hypothetical protein